MKDFVYYSHWLNSPQKVHGLTWDEFKCMKPVEREEANLVISGVSFPEIEIACNLYN